MLVVSSASPSTTISIPEDQFAALFPDSKGLVTAIAADIKSTLTASVNSPSFTAILIEEAADANVVVLETAVASSVETTPPVVQLPPTAAPTTAPATATEAAFPLYAIIIIVVVGGTLLLGGAAAGVFYDAKRLVAVAPFIPPESRVAVAPDASPA